MFLNLARRSQALVDRMIGELDHIERTEEDPKRLAQLFQLDHLATRMRRNDENLLVLAGADSAAPRREDALLIDAVRAAQSEVELYNRIEFGTVDADISIAAHAVNDVVRLLAELLDNATRFSPPNTVVVAEARRIRDYVLIQVEDHGLGINDDQLEALNRRLAEPPAIDVDVAAFRLMGLAVVSRLAARYGIQVELRHNSEGGTVAHVSLPGGILVLPQHRSRESVPAPRTPRAVEPATVGAGRQRGWSDGPRPALPTRTTAAIADPWEASPSRWDAPVEAPPLGNQVTAAHPTLAPSAGSPYAGYGADRVSTAYAAPSAAPTSAAPTSAGPTSTAPTSAAPTPSAGHAGAATSTGAAGPTATVGSRAEEMPIFRAMEASWFRGPDADGVEPWAMPTAGHPPPPAPPVAVTPAAGANQATGRNGYGAPQQPGPAGTPSAPHAGPTASPVRPASAAPSPAAPASPPAPSASAAPAPAAPVSPVAPGGGPSPAGPTAAPGSGAPYTGGGYSPSDAYPDRPAGAPTAGSAPTGSGPDGSGPDGGRSTDRRSTDGRSTDGRPTGGGPMAGGQGGYDPAAEVPRPAASPLPPHDNSPSPSPSPSAGGPPAPGKTWQTRADEGWRRASEAAMPAPAGTTRSGLPKRVPQAQLVPGGVEPTGGRDRSRRTPEEVRGLLSAYHRGVQRGRTAGDDAGGPGTERSQTKETRG
jgi:hypothetical protein